jgi:hypothetical protein
MIDIGKKSIPGGVGNDVAIVIHSFIADGVPVERDIPCVTVIAESRLERRRDRERKLFHGILLCAIGKAYNASIAVCRVLFAWGAGGACISLTDLLLLRR